MLLQMAIFHSFLWLSNIPLCVYIYHILLNQLSVDGHLGCFHVLAITNNAATNMGYMYLFELEFFVFSICMPRSGITE